MPTWPWHWIGYGIAAIGVAAVLFWIVGDRSRGRPRCPRCWYDLARAGEPPLTCPECGREITALKHLHRPRRRKGHAIAALGLMLVGYASIATPRVQATGWRGAVPTTVLVVAAPWLPRAWHDEHFYITGDAGAQHEHLQAMLAALDSEQARAVQQKPSTLAEELMARWKAEPEFVDPLAAGLWNMRDRWLGRPAYWNHGKRETVQLTSVTYHLWNKSYRAGRLSRSPGLQVRRDDLARLAPRLAYMDSVDRVGVRATMYLLFFATPEADRAEVRLLEGASPGATEHLVTPFAAPQQIPFTPPVGPIHPDAPRVVIEYRLLDAEGAELCRHVVAYEFEILDLPPGQPQPDVRNPTHWVMGNIWPVEVDGQPVRIPSRSHRGAPIVLKAPHGVTDRE